MSTIAKRAAQSAVLLLTMFGVFVALPGAASAAAWADLNPGTVNDDGSWFVGGTVHTKSGTGNVTIRFTKMPKTGEGKPGGIKVAVKKVGGTSWSDTVKFKAKETESKWLFSYSSGTKFEVRYARLNNCGDCVNTFEGEIWR